MRAPSGTAARVVGAYERAPPRPFLIDMSWMVCQYSRPDQVSSEKKVTPGTEVDGLGGHAARVGAVTVVMGGYCPLPRPLTAISRPANSARVLGFRTCGRLYSCDTFLGWLTENFKGTSFATSGSTSEPASLTHDGL
jgi:hypothetical protein